MKRVSVTVLKNKLSSYLRLVKRGEIIEITERSIPIARIEAVRGKPSGDDHLERLVRDGIVRPGTQGMIAKFLQRKPVRCEADAVKVLVEERGNK